MNNNKKRSDHSLAAAMIRKELKEAFPETKFTVRSSSYTGGTSIRANWVDGPITDRVRKIIDKYRKGDFNGMEDIYEYRDTGHDLPTVKYVFANRDMSDEVKESLTDYVRNNYAGCADKDWNDWVDDWNTHFSCLCRKIWAKHDFTYMGEEFELNETCKSLILHAIVTEKLVSSLVTVKEKVDNVLTASYD